jgi:hypothetical protein
MANPDGGSLLAPRVGPSRNPRCRGCPNAWPTSNSNTAEGQGVLTQYYTALLHRLRAGAKRSTNMFKIDAVTQKSEESPIDFYERLCEAF